MNWVGTSRSNYFRVKDPVAFTAAMERIEVDVRPNHEDPSAVAVFSQTEDGDWPSLEMYDDAAAEEAEGADEADDTDGQILIKWA